MQTINNNNLKIAIQQKGRLSDKSLELLTKVGLDFDIFKRKLISECRNFPLDILFIRDDNIPDYVARGIADLGIVGEDMVQEQQVNVKILEKLNFANCSLKIACPDNKKMKTLENLQNKKIATSYPNSLKKYLEQNNIKAKIIKLSGSVEIAPSLGIADCICDIVSTGNTLKTNGLTPIFDIFDSQAVLIANTNFDIKKLINIYERTKNCQ